MMVFPMVMVVFTDRGTRRRLECGPYKFAELSPSGLYASDGEASFRVAHQDCYVAWTVCAVEGVTFDGVSFLPAAVPADVDDEPGDWLLGVG